MEGEIIRVESKVWAMLSYLGPLCLWSAMKTKEDEFVRFHVKQGLVLFIIELLLWTVMALPIVSLFFYIVGRLFLGLAIVWGVISALSGEYRSIPVVGSLANKIVL